MRHIEIDRAREILSKADKLKIAVAGDLMLDVYLSGSATRLSQEAPVPVLQAKEKIKRLGGAANVMRNLTALGANALACGVIGNDDCGNELIKLMLEGGIDCSSIVRDDSRRTTEKLRVIAGTQQVVRIDFEDVNEISAEIEQKAEKILLDVVCKHKIDALIFEDYAKGMLSEKMVQKIADAARQNGIFTSLDPHPGHPIKAQGLSLMTPNRQEAFGLAGIYCSEAVSPVEKDIKLAEVAEKILELWQCKSLLITLGAQGMALFKKNSSVVVIPTQAKEVFDVSGAGDTVIATYTLCRAAGASDTEAALISNYAAGIVVGKLGTATTTPDEILKNIENDYGI